MHHPLLSQVLLSCVPLPVLSQEEEDSWRLASWWSSSDPFLSWSSYVILLFLFWLLLSSFQKFRNDDSAFCHFVIRSLFLFLGEFFLSFFPFFFVLFLCLILFFPWYTFIWYSRVWRSSSFYTLFQIHSYFLSYMTIIMSVSHSVIVTHAGYLLCSVCHYFHPLPFSLCSSYFLFMFLFELKFYSMCHDDDVLLLFQLYLTSFHGMVSFYFLSHLTLFSVPLFHVSLLSWCINRSTHVR